MKDIEKILEDQKTKESIKNAILEYTKEAMHKTALGKYFSDDVIEKRIQDNIKYIEFKTILNCESPVIEDGILSIDKFLLNKDFEYSKEVLTSFGIYAVISDCKKFNVTNDMLATYFSALAVKGDNYRYIKELNCNSFLNHNLTYSNQISIFHELMGEEVIAKICSKIDGKHSFYDNLYELINYMSIPNAFSKSDLKKLEKSMNKIYNRINNTLGVTRTYNIIARTYNGIFKMIVDKLSSKYAFGEFFRFFDKFKTRKFNIKSINKEYNIGLVNRKLTREEKSGLTKLLDILYNSELDINNYNDVDAKCNEYLKLKSDSILYLRKKILKEETQVDMLLMSKFVLPLVNKYKASHEETENIEKIFHNVLTKTKN